MANHFTREIEKTTKTMTQASTNASKTTIRHRYRKETSLVITPSASTRPRTGAKRETLRESRNSPQKKEKVNQNTFLKERHTRDTHFEEEIVSKRKHIENLEVW